MEGSELRQEQHIDVRADLFNTFNIADYAPPDSGMTDSNFGQITGIVNGNRSAQLSLKYAFKAQPIGGSSLAGASQDSS